MDKLRSAVRPLVMLSGWGTLLFLVIFLVYKFVDSAIATAIITLFTGSISTLMGFWFAERKK